MKIFSNYRIQNYIVCLYALFALFFVSLAIIGGIKNFSSVPFDDMWGGYLNFFLQASEGNLKVWFAAWNEHPIILSRLLFWIDLEWFKGLSIFLIAVNYLLIASSCVVFSAFLKEALDENSLTQANETRSVYAIFSLLIIILLFSWLERENLNWAFQSQFFLAQLLPLISFYLIHKSYSARSSSDLWFLAACFAGFASFATMANGVFALPLLTLFAYWLGMNKKRLLVLLLLSITVWYLFFQSFYLNGTKMPEHLGILQYKLLLFKYIIHYFGGPAYYLSHGNNIITDLTSVIFITAFVFKLWQLMVASRGSSWQLALLFFIFYIICSALIVSFARFHYQIPSMRYMYPMLMAWSALLVLYAPFLLQMKKAYTLVIMGLLLFFPLVLLPTQLNALNSQANDQLEKKTAALALALSVKDSVQIRKVSQFPDQLFSLADKATSKNISIFGQEPYKDLKKMLKQLESPANEFCLGSINPPQKIADNQYLALNGWIGQPQTNSAPSFIHILNGHNQIIGYAFTTAVKSPDNPQLSLFKGYILAAESGKQIILNGKKPACKLVLQASKLFH